MMSLKIGDLVRFNHERDGGPVHRVVSVMSDGMIEVSDMGGYFAPHLFTVADDVADIPPTMKGIAKFEKQTYGATVATILETDNSIVEVQERNDGVYGLIIHTRHEDRDQWDDLTAYLKSDHFDALGSVARRMRGESECCKGLAPIVECRCERLRADRAEQNLALYDALRETATTADELAFWRYQAIWGRAYLLQPAAVKQPLMEDTAVWREAERQLDAARVQENLERVGHAEEPRDPGAT